LELDIPGRPLSPPTGIAASRLAHAASGDECRARMENYGSDAVTQLWSFRRFDLKPNVREIVVVLKGNDRGSRVFAISSCWFPKKKRHNMVIHRVCPVLNS
jgi:hypothetical protein